MLLADPAATGQHIGSLLDAVADTRRLERTVARNDEVRHEQGTGAIQASVPVRPNVLLEEAGGQGLQALSGSRPATLQQHHACELRHDP